MFFNLSWIWIEKTLVSSFYKENNFKSCLNKKLLNMFKLWCEWGISHIVGKLGAFICFTFSVIIVNSRVVKFGFSLGANVVLCEVRAESKHLV